MKANTTQENHTKQVTIINTKIRRIFKRNYQDTLPAEARPQQQGHQGNPQPAHTTAATKNRVAASSSSVDGVVVVGGLVVVVIVVVPGVGGVVVQSGIVQGDGAVVAHPGSSRGKRGIL